MNVITCLFPNLSQTMYVKEANGINHVHDRQHNPFDLIIAEI